MKLNKRMSYFLLGAGLIAYLLLLSLSLASEVRDNIYLVAGNMVEPDDYYGDIAIKKGYGYSAAGADSTIVRAAGMRWFNIPIMTPTNIENTDVYLHEVYLLFESDRKVLVERIEVYDGFDLISVNLPTFNLTFSTQTYRYLTVGPENTVSFQTPHKMKSALNIRVLVNFENAQFDFNNLEYMEFVGAGAKFRRF